MTATFQKEIDNLKKKVNECESEISQLKLLY